MFNKMIWFMIWKKKQRNRWICIVDRCSEVLILILSSPLLQILIRTLYTGKLVDEMQNFMYSPFHGWFPVHLRMHCILPTDEKCNTNSKQTIVIKKIIMHKT